MEKSFRFREARKEDLEQIIQMLADDELGKSRERYEQPLPSAYTEAFEAIERDTNNELIVSCIDDKVIAVLQLTFTPYLTYQGGIRATIEGVRTSKEMRGKGIGAELIQWAISRAKGRGCHVVQLTTDKKRPEALRFYEKLGFSNTHEGLKLHL